MRKTHQKEKEEKSKNVTEQTIEEYEPQPEEKHAFFAKVLTDREFVTESEEEEQASQHRHVVKCKADSQAEVFIRSIENRQELSVESDRMKCVIVD